MTPAAGILHSFAARQEASSKHFTPPLRQTDRGGQRDEEEEVNGEYRSRNAPRKEIPFRFVQRKAKMPRKPQRLVAFVQFPVGASLTTISLPLSLIHRFQHFLFALLRISHHVAVATAIIKIISSTANTVNGTRDLPRQASTARKDSRMSLGLSTGITHFG